METRDEIDEVALLNQRSEGKAEHPGTSESQDRIGDSIGGMEIGMCCQHDQAIIQHPSSFHS